MPVLGFFFPAPFKKMQSLMKHVFGEFHCVGLLSISVCAPMFLLFSVYRALELRIAEHAILTLWIFGITFKRHFLCTCKLVCHRFRKAEDKCSRPEINWFLYVKNN